jgi:hypothetical protein
MARIPASGLTGPVKFIPSGRSGMFSDRHFYKLVGFRKPMKGEWYLSGAIIEAYQAPNDLGDEFYIVEKGPRAVRRTIEVPA